LIYGGDFFVSRSANDSLEKLVFEMTCYVSSETRKTSHSVTFELKTDSRHQLLLPRKTVTPFLFLYHLFSTS